MMLVELIGGPHCGAIIRWNVESAAILVEDRGIVAQYIRESEKTALWAGLPASSAAA